MKFNWTLLSDVQSPDYMRETDNSMFRDILSRCPRLTEEQVRLIRMDVCPKCGHRLVTQDHPAYESGNGKFRYEATYTSACYGCDSHFLT